MSYCVYKHTSPSNKVYIGITCQEPLKRWHSGLGYTKNEYFYRAIQKYGWTNFKHEIIIDGLSKEEAESMEIRLISEYKSNDSKYGYNICSGGNVNIPSKQSIDKFKSTRKANPWGEVRITSHMITYNGKTQTLSQWSKETGIPRACLSARINKCGWDIERALTEPLKNRNALYTYNGKTQSLYQWADESNIRYNTLVERMCRMGLSFEEAINYRRD